MRVSDYSLIYFLDFEERLKCLSELKVQSRLNSTSLNSSSITLPSGKADLTLCRELDCSLVFFHIFDQEQINKQEGLGLEEGVSENWDWAGFSED